MYTLTLILNFDIFGNCEIFKLFTVADVAQIERVNGCLDTKDTPLILIFFLAGSGIVPLFLMRIVYAPSSGNYTNALATAIEFNKRYHVVNVKFHFVCFFPLTIAPNIRLR